MDNLERGVADIAPDTTTQMVVNRSPTLLRSTNGAHLDSTGVA